MQIIYRAANLSDAHLLRQLMEAEGIPAFVQGEFLQGAVGELPANTEVFVHVPDAHVEAARALVADWESSVPVEPEGDGLDAEDDMPAISMQPRATAVRRLLLFLAIAVGGAVCYEMLLRYAAR